MKKTTLLLTMLLTLAACKEPAAVTAESPAPAAPAVTTPAPAPVSNALVLTDQGYGPVRFGQRLADVEQMLGEKGQSRGAVADPACRYVKFDKAPGAQFMVENGVITRAEADTGIPNALGLSVGDTLQQAQLKHPSVQVGPHKYVEEGHYLTFRSSDSKSAIVMEEDGSKITRIRAGFEPAVSYVEGCL